MTAALEGGEWSASRPGRTLLVGKTWYPSQRRMGGPQGRSGRAENISPPGFDSRNVQSVAQSLYRLSYPAQKLRNYPDKYHDYIRRSRSDSAFAQCREARELRLRIRPAALWLLVFVFIPGDGLLEVMG